MTKILMALTWAAIPTGSFAVAATPKLDREKIERLTGLKGSYNEKEGVFKVTFPRIDIKSTAANYKRIAQNRRAILDRVTLAIAAVTLLLILKTKRIPEPLLILAAGIFGVLWTGL